MKNALLGLAMLAVVAPAAAWDRLDGQYSGVRTQHTEAVTDEASWKALWARHAPDQAVPAVSFEREQVAAVFLGQTPTAGVTVDVDVMNDPLDSTRLVVFYQPVRPARAGFAASVMATPFVFVKTRRAAEVVFELNASVSVPGREPRLGNPVDGRRVRLQLDSLFAPSFDGR